MRAIDIHVHPPAPPEARSEDNAIAEQMRRYFRQTEPRPVDIEQWVELFSKHDIVACLLPIDSETESGVPYTGNDWVAKLHRDHPKNFIPFCSVDPWKGKKAIYEAERAVKELGARGMKFFPSRPAFFANDRRFYPLWEKVQELGIPILTHSGHAAAGSGLPGGGGIKLKYNEPIIWDDVAADFPELKIILAHPSWPWQAEQISMCVHKANVFMDISGWSPKYFPADTVHEMNSRIQDKVLFGSDYPALHLERWLRDWDDVLADVIKDDIKPKIFLENAKKVLGITDWPE
jgi:predicted TIM-barrel fold metal-dependent hydrolase